MGKGRSQKREALFHRLAQNSKDKGIKFFLQIFVFDLATARHVDNYCSPSHTRCRPEKVKILEKISLSQGQQDLNNENSRKYIPEEEKDLDNAANGVTLREPVSIAVT